MNKKKVGVVVGRFQTPELHEGHRYLLDAAHARFETVCILIGVPKGALDDRNPMDYETRALMLQTRYPNAIIDRVLDLPSDEEWSEELDAMLAGLFPDADVTLFGSRDSFLGSYMGRYPQATIPGLPNIAAQDIRTRIIPRDSADFRAGMIYAALNQFPTSYQTVDLAIRHSLEPRVVVGRKAGEKLWRFPGGFVDPKDSTLEAAMRREVKEEVGDIEISGMSYIGSFRVDDFRYRKSPHRIMTALFWTTYVFGPLRAHDDLAEVRWQDFAGLVECVVPEHKTLAQAFLDSVGFVS